MNASAHPATVPATLRICRTEHFPVALFAIVMGLTGLALAWLKLHHLGGAPAFIGNVLRLLASALFVFLAAMYLAKLVRHPQAVRADWMHPVKLNFFPAISIGLILLAVAWARELPGFAA